ncbi:S8 family peptidase [Priestia megaterium]|uniref:S8 family peptidase n=1 Tax=Priestia megaterium TaxID=1404 RepID=UPI0027958BBD|nr:S8 family serine peptidase [Priestia megaterium]
MKKKKNVYLIILLIFSALIAVYFVNKGSMKKEVLGEVSKTIDAQSTFPYTEKIRSKIAVIDTGARIDNSFLKESNVTQEYLDELSQTSRQMHGTMVVGILASNGNGESDPYGLIPKSNILSIQAGTDMGMTSSQLIKSIDMAIEKKAKIINISMGTTNDSKELRKVVNKALGKGIIIIASAGNQSVSKKYYPASYEGVISVGSINNKKEVSEKVNPTNVDIFAPGEKLLTTSSTKEEKSYFSGNSAATPVVTSTVAVLLNENNNLTSKDIESILKTTSQDGIYENHKIKILDVKHALKKASTLN